MAQTDQTKLLIGRAERLCPKWNQAALVYDGLQGH
jgi:hypothetical protein